MQLTRLTALACCLLPAACLAQSPVIITIEVENYVEYLQDNNDVMKTGTDPGVTTPLFPNTFINSDHYGDIVSVNGVPAKGLLYGFCRVLGASARPNPGFPIADTTVSTQRAYYFQIQSATGTPIGTLVTSGPHGPSGVGNPTAVTNGDYVILGGSGAFIGARGQGGLVPVAAGRTASITEDPSRRRVNGGGKRRFILTMYPAAYPQISGANGLPAIAHASDFTQVSPNRPASPGEILSMWVTGLGPTRPTTDPGQPFPASPLANVNSPVQVTVNGKTAEVLSAVGFPGTSEYYQVNFRVPPDVDKGLASVRVTAAWIPSAAATIAVQ
jgi:hypothetical protein